MRFHCVAISAVLSLLALLVLACPALAHEFLVIPEATDVAPGQEIGVSVVSCHVFMVSEEAEPLEHVTVGLLQNGETVDVDLAENTDTLTLDGMAAIPAEGGAILVGHREGVVWCNTTQGWVQGSKQEAQNVISSGKYEKFCKVLLVVDGNSQGFDTVVGDRLEIVPLQDPAQASVGDDIQVQVLFDGQPLAVDEVLATYDGFTDAENTYAYMTEPDGDGIARIKVHSPGLWMVRVQHILEEETADYDKHVMRAALIFQVD
ncbi:MAG: DUF4198 domain-containing protein [Desulfovibrio sp.]|nr:MAG: DUF4198 domain-containing protein [Desulfovibrio sp.]